MKSLLKRPRPGSLALIDGRRVEFSFFPTTHQTAEPALQHRVFSSDPWSILTVLAASAQDASRPSIEALIAQGSDLHRAALSAQDAASKPLLLYYSMMQLVKAFCISRNAADPVSRFGHGIRDRSSDGADPIDTAVLRFEDDRKDIQSIFTRFLSALGAHPLKEVPVRDVFSQVLIGSRAFATARGESDRFFEVSTIEIRRDKSKSALWLRIRIRAGDLKRFGYTRESLLCVTNSANEWGWVENTTDNGIVYYVLEQKNTTPFSGNVINGLENVVAGARRFLWRSVTTVSPFRRYYLLRAGGLSATLPQLASIYAGMFFLGSITRYRPDEYRRLLTGKYGIHISEYMTSQMAQFLYLITSEWLLNDVARPAIVS